MKNRRKNSKNGNSDSDNSSDEEILENTNNNLPTINNEERYFLKKIFPILPSSTSPPKSKLIFSIILDIIGFVTQIIPIFGITIWPSLSTYLIYKVYGPGLHLSLSFIEETVNIPYSFTLLLKKKSILILNKFNFRYQD
ncbi:hypothetical protein DICPUDRAFT_26402 [Dictyostelium purpureum]|uniref:Uncharacterized protein n=1 Tax=Dictyostelium purpureum TaxID=5786 RepID=F0Z8N6_DICPU|nr:uncharacterized protein DICPUDRAFT_26402 [Dictyostelium purpureum]EGC39666.1 hypothetical protein DICPUDRAFT_26402 [Dictyostelium purpureum]|eukprot:XP_003283775.1 hypothetical protein DICPUDRAFT_26402 [Dictyostelium purpureum]